MHPAPSIIFFTTASGIGFGCLFFLGLGIPALSGTGAFAAFALAYGLAVGGLIASTFHLGHPERALRAFTQWRTSWLSREGWASVAVLGVMGLFGAGLVFRGSAPAILGWAGSALALGAVYCTSMIYAQLRTVPRWHTPLTPVLFVALSLAGGSFLSGQREVTLGLVLLAGAVQILWWWRGDRAFGASGTTLASATGLGGTGALRLFEPPHTGSNYLLREMVHVVGRRHAAKLRVIALVLICALPLLLVIAGSGPVVMGLALVSHAAGVAASRWLFFAEAEHVVGLYYGRT